MYLTRGFKSCLVLLLWLSAMARAADFNDTKARGAKSLHSEGAKAFKRLEAPPKMKSLEKKSHAAESRGKSVEDSFELGVGLQLGSGATYGNGLVANFDVERFIRGQLGAGYNSTGPKVGAGLAVVIPFAQSFGLDAGGAYCHSFGIKDTVSLDAYFTSEGSSQKESVEAIRKFRISPGNYYSVYVGGYYALMDSIWLDFHLIYNKFVSGHQVEFYDTVSFNKPIEPSNEETLQADFDKKGRARLNATGPGLSLGVQFRI